MAESVRGRPWRVAYLEAVTPETAELVLAGLPAGWELVRVPDRSEEAARRAAADADFILVGNRRISAELIAGAPHVRLIQHHGVGYDGTDIVAARAAGIPVAITLQGTRAQVAEHAFLLMLAIYRRLDYADASVRAGQWMQFGLRSTTFDLAGKTLGIVGLGRIGSAVAQRAVPFEMRVCYYDIVRRSPEQEQAWSLTFLPFDELLAAADILTLHVPLTPVTRHLMNAETIGRMHPGSVLINTSRGPVVDPQALHAALQQGPLAGAGLDVYEPEPPGADNPLYTLPNIVLTPHTAAGTRDAMVQKVQGCFANMQRVARGEPPSDVVN